MADRKTWGTRLMIGGGIAAVVGLLLKLTWSGQVGTGENSAGKPRGKCKVTLRPDGLYYGGVDKTTTGDIIASCDRVALSTTGDAKYGDLTRIQNALIQANIPIT